LSCATSLFTLSLHDALPISERWRHRCVGRAESWLSQLHVHLQPSAGYTAAWRRPDRDGLPYGSRHRPLLLVEPLSRPEEEVCDGDRKSTRLNSSHGSISYAV